MDLNAFRAPAGRIIRVGAGEVAYEAFVDFFLRGVAEEAGDAVTKARRLQDLQTEWRAKLTAARASGLAFRLLERLFTAPILTIPQAQKMLGVTYRTAKAQVEKLAGLGILAPANGKRRGKVYLAQSILAVLEEPRERNYTSRPKSIIRHRVIYNKQNLERPPGVHGRKAGSSGHRPLRARSIVPG
ncbi:MAG: hypothetical protein ACUVRM_06160 [Bacillota bacterium]